MSTGMILFVLTFFLLLFIGLGTPIAFCLGFLSVVGILTFLEPSVLSQIVDIALQSGTNLFLITLPLFIFMAEVISSSGVGSNVYAATNKWLSWLPGGLAVSSIATCSGFAAISGSSPATAATIGLISIPEMLKHGYNRRLAVGSIVAGGTLGILIPPSITFIIYGMMTEESIGKLFIAGIVPGIILSIMLSSAIVLAIKFKPHLAPGIGRPVSWSERFYSLKDVWPFVALSLLILGTIYTGIATPTESAAIGTVAAIIIALIYRNLNLTKINQALMRTVTITAMIMFMVIGGNSLAFFIASLGIPQYLSGYVASSGMSPWTVMIMINILLLILGCLFDPISIMVITLPIFFPIVAKLGFDPIWFGVILTINIEIGMITPPFGLNLFVIKGIMPELKMRDIVLGSLPFVLVLMLGIVIIMIFPSLATWLPMKMLK